MALRARRSGSSFKALADPTRRSLLDALFAEDGQPLSARKRGREKLHFLNPVPIRPVPIRLIHDRWVSKYAEPWVETLTDLKNQIKTTPGRLWEAITNPQQRASYSFGVAPESDWTPGSAYRAGVPGVVDIAAGENVVVDQLPPSANAELYGGWPMILSGLKTLLETGEHLDTPGSLMYQQA